MFTKNNSCFIIFNDGISIKIDDTTFNNFFNAKLSNEKIILIKGFDKKDYYVNTSHIRYLILKISDNISLKLTKYNIFYENTKLDANLLNKNINIQEYINNNNFIQLSDEYENIYYFNVLHIKYIELK